MYDYENGVDLKVYAVKEGQKAETCVYSKDNEKKLAVSVSRIEGQYHITVVGGKNVTVTLVNTKEPVEVSGADYTMDENNLLLKVKDEKMIVKF